MKKILIINANYYKNISHGLVESAKKKILNKYKIKIINVPGVFEIPVTISKNLKKYDAFIALGCVIKGKHLILILFLKLQQMLLWICQFSQKNQLEMV